MGRLHVSQQLTCWMVHFAPRGYGHASQRPQLHSKQTELISMTIVWKRRRFDYFTILGSTINWPDSS